MTSPFDVSFDGATFHGESDGFGLPVVFLHSGVTDRRMWDVQMREVAEAGYHVMSYDRRGHGETETDDVPFSDVVDLEAILDRLSIHAAIFVGSSMGGALAIDFALEHPERTIGLVLIGTAISGADSAEIPEEAADLEDALDYARERGSIETVNRIEAHLWLDGPLEPQGRVDGELRDLFLTMNRIVLNHPELTEREEADDATVSLSTITAPTLLVVGELDFPDIVARHEDLSEELENSFAVVLEETAHFPSYERPDLFNPLLLEFLDAVSGQGGEIGEDDA